MAITDELGYSTTAINNTTMGASITLDGAVMTPSQVDDAFREEMSHRAKSITRAVTKAAGSYTAVRTDYNQLWRCTGAVTVNLTAAATLTTGWCLWIKANGGAVTIDPNGSETIDGATTLVLADGQSAFILCDASNFFVGMLGTTGGSVPSGYIFGLIATTNASDATNDVDIAAGTAASDDAEPVRMVLASALGKRLDAAWTVGGTPGSSLGGLDTGAVGNNQYYIWLIRRPDTGVVDALFSLSSSSPTMPANYTQKRLIGQVNRLAAANELLNPYSPLKEVRMARVAAGTATTKDIVGFPSDTVEIDIAVDGISLGGADTVSFWLGDAGGIEATGYLGATLVLSNAGAVGVSNPTTSFVIGNANAANVYQGRVNLKLTDPASNTWEVKASFGYSNTTGYTAFEGIKPTSAVLTQVRFGSTAGVQVFDAGAFAVTYKRTA